VYQTTPAELEHLLHETAVLERLIEDLRLLALAEAGQLPLYLETLDLADLLQRTTANFAVQAQEQGVTLHVAVPEELPAIEGDPQRISQVLTNLLTNALRYTPAGGTVTLRGEARNGRAESGVLLSVQDTGQGIAPEDLPHVFERFWRADRSRTRSSGGSGLGLAITRQIVEAHGGTIDMISIPGHGTTVQIALPSAPATS
jgi:two-component system OmpR family sensor kinase/two-component system sensor histidine kinase BaeS